MEFTEINCGLDIVDGIEVLKSYLVGLEELIRLIENDFENLDLRNTFDFLLDNMKDYTAELSTNVSNHFKKESA